MDRLGETERLMTCGTRKVVRHAPGDYRVVCATCDGGGTVKHSTRHLAAEACMRESAKPCPTRHPCGAE